MTHLDVCHDAFTCVPWLTGVMYKEELQHGGKIKPTFHDSFIRVRWPIQMCAMTHSCVCHVSFACVPWLLHMFFSWNPTFYYSFISVPWLIPPVLWLIPACAMTHSPTSHDSFICVPWLNHLCAMTHSHVCHDDSFTRVSWLTGVVHAVVSGVATKENPHPMTHSYVCNDSFICVPWLIHMCAMTHSNECHDCQVWCTNLKRGIAKK